MAKRVRQRLVAVGPGMEPYTLRTQWRDGQEAVINIAAVICSSKEHAPIVADEARFRRVELDDASETVRWPDGIGVPAETLWRLAQEQTGRTMSSTAFRRWRASQSLTLDGAAKALGLSRRMIAYYEHGSKPIPRVVALATQAIDRSFVGQTSATLS